MHRTDSPYRGRRVLIVEDDDDAGDLLESHLLRLECVVLRVAAGEDCLQLLVTQRVELAIVDLMLLGSMTGWDVVEALRSGDVGTIAVVVSSVLDPLDYPGGIDGALPKPVTRQAVEALLDDLWGRAGGGWDCDDDSGIRRGRR